LKERKIMRFTKFAGGIAAATLALGLFTGIAQANETIGQLTGQTPRGESDVTFTSNGAGGGTLVTNGLGARVSAVGPIENGSFNDTFDSYFVLNGGIDQVTGSASTSAGKTVAQFGAGAFSIIRRSDSALLLSGIFSGVDFSSVSGSTATLASIGLNGVTYDGGLFRNEFLTLNPGDTVIGTFGLSLSAINPNVTSSGGGLSTFGAQAISGTLDATTTTTAVPEPSEWMAIGMATTALGGLMVRARRRRTTAAV
jgi:hypothetical protein